MTENTHITLTAPQSVNMALVVGPGDCLLHQIEEAFDSRASPCAATPCLKATPSRSNRSPPCSRSSSSTWRLATSPTRATSPVPSSFCATRSFRPRRCARRHCSRTAGRAIRPKTAGQKHYVDAIRNSTVTFGIGPAGTGKTYLAMAMAVAALKRKEVGRIILTRPVVEAGRNSGFLPGTLSEKVDRPSARCTMRCST